MQDKSNNNTAIIFSSARKTGNTSSQVSEYLQKEGGQGFCLDDFVISPYLYDKNYPEDEFYTLFEQLLSFEHWVIASPIYWYNTTPQMKAFMDRITDYMDDEALKPKLRKLRTKQFSLLSNAASPEAPDAFLDMFKHTFNYLGMTFKAHSHVQAS